MGELAPLSVPPGVVGLPTPSVKSTNWAETHLMRWVGSRLSPVGGWEAYSFSDFESRCRAVHTWSDNSGVKHTAYLCEEHLYVETAGEIFDATPTDGITSPTNTVDDGGYGDYIYGYGEYGTARPPAGRQKEIAPIYSIGNWGQELRAMTSADGRLLKWSPATPSTEAVAVTGAPTGNRSFVITPERHMMIFAPNGSFREFIWSDEEDDTDYTIAVDSKAGGFDIEPASPIVTAAPTLGGTIMFTAAKAYIITPIGLPYIYAYNEIGEGSTPYSPHSLASTSKGAFWFSESGFWTFNGASIDPVPCSVWEWIQKSISPFYARLYAHFVNVASLSELWWFYPSSGATSCDRYVIYNYREGWWATGYLSRSAGCSSRYDGYPIMVGNNGRRPYKHESGLVYPGNTLKPYAKTHVLNVASGARLATLDQLMVDIDEDVSKFAVEVKYRSERSNSADLTSGDLSVWGEGMVEVRKTGRDFHLVAKSVADSARWTMGQFLIDMKPRGRR